MTHHHPHGHHHAHQQQHEQHHEHSHACSHDHDHADHSHEHEHHHEAGQACTESHQDTAPKAFCKPGRGIFSPEDLKCFHESQAFKDFIQFCEDLGASVKSSKLTDSVEISPFVAHLIKLIEKLSSWVDEITPEPNKTRYGNPAFRKFYDRIVEESPKLLKEFIPDEAVVEVSEYLIHSFGDRERIDYGTGHEAHFQAFLLCFRKLGLIHDSDLKAVVLKVFIAYIHLMRKLQQTYWLEPAGSHGVWGLDDYQFLPFYFGSSQLIGHKNIRPKSVCYEDIVNAFAPEYLYLDCIRSINQVKTETLVWHSPMLYDISSAKSWDKVHGGLMKMYKVEVLGKLPIMQHFLFGSIISFESSHPRPQAGTQEYEHIHVTPNCCPRIPSAVAVKQTQEKYFPYD